MKIAYLIMLTSALAASAVMCLFKKSKNTINLIDLDEHEHESFHN